LLVPLAFVVKAPLTIVVELELGEIQVLAVGENE
jgi:hypothetical protein